MLFVPEMTAPLSEPGSGFCSRVPSHLPTAIRAGFPANFPCAIALEALQS
jgi:hypothetical protein